MNPPTIPAAAKEDRTLIDLLLEEQRRLTAVEVFSRAHDAHGLVTPRYRSLLPASPPGPGQQYAFEVNLDQCSGCKACVAACHSLNGLDDGEAWRDIGQLLSDDWRRPFQQTVTTACHHCVDPGCLNGCPVLAYEKDPSTGLVRHLDDQCIGCQYCVMKCPYEVPKYSEARGIVRKCDMCAQRLAVNEAPACAQACPNEAIRITLIDQEAEFHWRRSADAVKEIPRTDAPLAASPWLPAAPNPAITLPTTRFISTRPLAPDLIPADAAHLRRQPAHWPLVWMLALTQMSVGALAAAFAITGPARSWCLRAALVVASLGLAASVLHLGKPMKAWRSFLGLRRSWLSREIVVFGLFAPLLAGTVCLNWIQGPDSWQRLSLAATLACGAIGIACSAMIYHDTRRVFWHVKWTLPKFFLTGLILGLSLAWTLAAPTGSFPHWLLPILPLATMLKFAMEQRALRQGESPLADESWPKQLSNFDAWSLAQSGRLLTGELGLVTRWRFFCGLAGGVLAPLLSLLPGFGVAPLALVALLLCLAGEAAERFTFFRVVVPPRMPGAV